MAPSCKIELARFSARLRIQDEAECGNIMAVTTPSPIRKRKKKEDFVKQKAEGKKISDTLR